MIPERLAESFARVALSPDPDLAVAALMIARLEYPSLDAGRYLDRLDALGQEAGSYIDAMQADAVEPPLDVDPAAYRRITALNDYLFREQSFCGNQSNYEDPRNSCLNEVLDRRTGIPITLALVYMEVARRVGIVVEGINFPGHFLLRCPAKWSSRLIRTPGDRRRPPPNDLIIDAFHGAILSEHACRERLREYGARGQWEPHLVEHATKPQILVRMLINLKRVYVRMRSFPQARAVIELLVALDPSRIDELLDRGLLAYQLNDYPAAVRDLQRYLQLSSNNTLDEDGRKEQARAWEHVKAIRRRMASLN